jgi:hypothetical protein
MSSALLIYAERIMGIILARDKLTFLTKIFRKLAYGFGLRDMHIKQN